MELARVGFIGCGTHSTNNIYPMLKYARCRLDAVCDLNEDLAKRNALIFGASTVYTDAEKMLDERKLDGVFVVGPSEIHYILGKKILERSIPLFVEKPPAPNLESVREMVDIAKKKGVFVMTGFMKRHGMPYKKAREFITSGQFNPAVGFFKYGHWQSNDLRGMLLGMSIHIIDLAISFFGEVAFVTSCLYNAKGPISLAVTLQFQSGQWAQIMLDSSQPRIQERVEISGTMNGGNALIIIDNIQQMELHRQGRNGIDLLAPSLAEINPDFDLRDIQVWRPDYGIPNMGQNRPFFQGFAGEVREFVDAIIEKREPYPSSEDSLKSMRVIEAISANPNGATEIIKYGL